MAWQAEKDAAPIVTRDVMVAMLAQMRKDSRWMRATFWLVAATLVATVVLAFVR
jgi:hypothetical protein